MPASTGDFSARLKQALNKSKVAAATGGAPPTSIAVPATPTAPDATAGAPGSVANTPGPSAVTGAPGVPSVTGASGATLQTTTPASTDDFSARLRSAMDRTRPATGTQEESDGTLGGPVGQGGYLVRAGDCISSIAFAHGFFPETLWTLPENSSLREVRKEMNVLLAGDRVTIPEKRRKDEPIAPEQRHRFKRRGVPEKLVIHFRTEGEPRANEHYYLEIDGVVTEGDTDSNGRVEIAIPPDARRGSIIFVDAEEAFELDLGHLPPITEITGVKSRLKNLGHYDGPIDDRQTPELESAIRSFQAAQQLEVTGVLDDEVRDKLVEFHGS